MKITKHKKLSKFFTLQIRVLMMALGATRGFATA
jgi:hypothetical protein